MSAHSRANHHEANPICNFYFVRHRNSFLQFKALIPLPSQAQVSALNGMVVDDFDDDGNLDVLINGNDFGTDVSTGRYDALNGLLLKGDGTGNFQPLSILQSGIYLPGNGKALVKLRGSNGKYLIAASQNRDPLKLYELKKKLEMLPWQSGDINAIIHLKDGRIRKEEIYYGSSFLSQSDNFITIGSQVVSVDIQDRNGGKRTITFGC